jgi:outer membrane protein assembly factor BamC
MDEVLPDREVEYKKEKQAEVDLEVPPDLTRSSISDALVVPDVAQGESPTYSEYMAGQQFGKSTAASQAVLPKVPNMRVERDGDVRWLVIDWPADRVWEKARAFWAENGILLIEEDPTVGVMETDWLENRADIDTDIVSNTLRRFLDGFYTAATRDQYRLRIESNTAGTTELYLTHRGLQEVLQDAGSGTTQVSVWQARPTDHGLEAEMLRRMMIFFGITDTTARRVLASRKQEQPRSQLVRDRDGNAALLINEDFARAWRLTGVALDRVGFAVEDRDRSRGVYYVRYNDPLKEDKKSGILSKLAFWSSDDVDASNEYQVKLSGNGDATRVIVLDKEGQPDTSPTAGRILGLVNEQIR